MIRPARPADEPALSALQSHLQAPSPSLLAAVVGGGPDVDAVTKSALDVDVGRCLVSPVDEVADADGATSADGVGDRPVGYALWVEAAEAHLAELVVHPEHRREGRGRALLRALLDRVEPGTRVTLFVAADNEAARSLYESVGFRPIDRRPDFYDGADAVVYAREANGGK